MITRLLRPRAALPALQVLAAIIALMFNHRRPVSFENPSWVAPERQLCFAVNAPASVVTSSLVMATGWASRHFPGGRATFAYLECAIDPCLFLVLVAVVWFTVILELSSWHRGRQSIFAARGRVGRRTVDLLLVLYGVGLGVFGVTLRNHMLRYWSEATGYWNAVAVLYLAWAAVLVLFYGYDLWASTERTL